MSAWEFTVWYSHSVLVVLDLPSLHLRTYVYKNFAMHAPITRVVTMDGNCGLVQCAIPA